MMKHITSYRESVSSLPWKECGRVLTALLTSEEWSGERVRLVGRNGMHFVIAVRGLERADDVLVFRLIADSPDLRHPLTGHVEIRPKTKSSTAIGLMVRANLDEEPAQFHLAMRESLTSLSDVLARTIVAAARIPSRDPEYADVAS